ncbi:Nn.00g086530.m01.CDS01 [Neocucurbitaria sp. VM-36]
MASYLQKLRRHSKQLIPQTDSKTADPKPQEAPAISEPPKISEPTAASSEPVQSPPAPTVTEPSDETAAEPVLDEEDERFLERLAAIASEPEGTPPPLPTRRMEVVDDETGEKKVGRDAQEALMDGADKVALPMSPPETTADTSEKGKEKAKDGGVGRKKSVMSYFSLPKFNKKDGDKGKEKIAKDMKKKEVSDKDKAQFADDLHSAAEAAKNAELTEAQKEDKELTDILDQLNLSAVNNRVFSFSKESEELLNKFTQVLKDLVNGVPTAYNDLEKLFTDYDNQLKKMYGNLPPFLQNLVKSLPAKLTATLGPELLAASAEKPGFDAKTAAGGSKSKRSMIPSVPSLKSLVTAQGAVATALRSIVNFLKFRFPALATGTNVIMSLAVFVLLFVFWYCHKRGRETRLEKERLVAEEAASGRGSSASSINEDADSIFGDKKKPAKQGEKETPKSPLIIGDGKETGESSATVEDMPSVSHLPDPKDGQVPKPASPPPSSK